MPRDDLTEGNPRVALGDALRDNWDAGEAGGYVLGDGLTLHLGQHDSEHGYPQLGLFDVSGQRQRSAWNADGSGTTHFYDGRIDIRVYVGSEDDVPEHAQLLCGRIADHARDIVHSIRELSDPHTGRRLGIDVEPLSTPQLRYDTDAEDVRYFAVVEVGYERSEQQP